MPGCMWKHRRKVNVSMHNGIISQMIWATVFYMDSSLCGCALRWHSPKNMWGQPNSPQQPEHFPLAFIAALNIGSGPADLTNRCPTRVTLSKAGGAQSADSRICIGTCHPAIHAFVARWRILLLTRGWPLTHADRSVAASLAASIPACCSVILGPAHPAPDRSPPASPPPLPCRPMPHDRKECRNPSPPPLSRGRA